MDRIEKVLLFLIIMLGVLAIIVPDEITRNIILILMFLSGCGFVAAGILKNG